MSTSASTVNLLFRAQNLADGAIADLTGGLRRVGDAAATQAGRVAGAFAGMGSKLANGIGNAVETLASGGSLTQALSGVGIYMAGQLAEQFGGQLLERLAGSSLIAAITAPLAAIGTTMGSIIAAAIPIGIAALPFILIGAIVAAITVLIVNPEIRQRVFDFVGELVGKIGDFLRNGLAILADIIPKAFAAAWQLIVDNVPKIIGQLVDLWQQLPFKLVGLGGDILRTIIGGLAGLAGEVGRVVANAFNSLRIDIGPFHISASGVRIDLPDINVPGFAEGVRGFAGGLAMVGERGRELVRLPRGADVIPNRQTEDIMQGAPARGVMLEGVTEAQIMAMVDRGLYFKLRASGVRG